jgi:hypothetical protein
MYGTTNIIILLDATFKNYNNQSDILHFITDRNITIRTDIIEYVAEKFGYSDVLITYIFDYILCENPEFIYSLVEKGFNLTTDILNKLLRMCSDKKMKYYNDGITMEISLIQLFDIYKLKPNTETLNIMCEKQDHNNINILINIHNVIPEKETLDICVKTSNIALINKMINYKIIPDSKTLMEINKGNSHNEKNEIVELLIAHGLYVNSNDVEYSLSRDFYIENLERFDIKYDENLYFTCYINNNWPDEYMKKFTIDKKILEMHALCKNKKITKDKLILFLTKSNLRLDRFAIDNLIFYTKLAHQIIYIYGCVPSVITAYKSTYQFCGLYNIGMKKLKYIATTHNITQKDMFEQYEMNFEKNEN